MTHEQEALDLIRKHNGVMISRGGTIAAITEALRQRDEAREEHRFALAAESAAIATLTKERDEAWQEIEEIKAQLTAQRDKAQARIDELLCLQAEERVFAQTAISDAKDDAERFKSQRDKAVEALKPMVEAHEENESVGPRFEDDNRIWISQAHGCLLFEMDAEHLRQAAAVVKGIEQ